MTVEAPTYQIELPAFTGPLDLLLHLVERSELDITAISLANVAEQYLEQIRRISGSKVDELMDFLVVGSRLLLIKSRALLPQMAIEENGEEDPAEALARQLRTYRRFKSAAQWLEDRERLNLRTFLRVSQPPTHESVVDMSGITVDLLIEALSQARERTGQQDDGVAGVVTRQKVTIDGQMRQLRRRLLASERVFFEELLSKSIGWQEIAVTLLAVLELIKRQEVSVRQPMLFGPIEILRS